MSLANRLSTFFLIALAVVLSGFSVTIFLLSRSHFEADLDERLGLALDALTPSVEVDPGRIQWRPLKPPPLDDIHSQEERIRWSVFDHSGNPIESSWELTGPDLRRIFDQGPDSGHVHSSFQDRDGRDWRLAIRRVSATPVVPHDQEREQDAVEHMARPANAARPLSMVLATGVALESTQAVLRNVAIVLVGISSGIWIVAAVVGQRLCRRALRPVTRMADVACAMSAADVDQRLPSPGTHDELEALASSFNGLLDRLHQALERQKRFTGDASHQLRTPLAGLLGQIEVARRRERPVEDYRLALDQIHCEAIRLRQIVDSLLFMARAENEATKPDLQPTRLDVWLSDHLAHWNGDERLADIRQQVPPDPVWGRVHVPLLAQLLDNLLDNACKYSRAGSPIVVRLETNSGRVQLIVEDQGFGIAPDDLSSVFDPFFRSAEARRRGQPGVGLGLSVVKRISEVFGAEIRAESQPGQGSRFILELPEAGPPGDNDRRAENLAGQAAPVQLS
jgi:signal transduction histidine kinase